LEIMGVWQWLQDLYPETEPDPLLQMVDRDFCGLIEELSGRSAKLDCLLSP